MNDDIDLADHEDGIGAEMAERELMTGIWPSKAGDATVDLADEPDNQALVGALLAQCGYAVEDLAQVDMVATLIDAPRETLAHSIRDLDHQLQLLLEVRDSCAQALAALMEDDHEAIAGLSVTRSRSDKVEWDKDGCWRAARANIADRWARNGPTFSTEKAEVIERTLADIDTAFAVTPRVGGLKAIGVNAHEYRAVTRGTRYGIKVQ